MILSKRKEAMRAELARLIATGADEPFINGFRRAMECLGNAGDVRPVVERFAEAMEAKLKLNDYKGGWKGTMDTYEVLERLHEELEELENAVNLQRNRKPGRILKEAADVANFAMILADICGELGDE